MTLTAVADIAEYDIRNFAGDVDRATAERLLNLWRAYGSLSMAERTAILARFPAPRPVRAFGLVMTP